MIKLFIKDSYNNPIKEKKFKFIPDKIFRSKFQFDLTESNWSRIVSHVKDGCFMISACRYENGEKRNKQRTEELANDLRSWGLGYIKVLGGYVENPNTENAHDVTEASYFVPYLEGYGKKKFFKCAIYLCKKYGQDSVLVDIPNFKKFGYFNSRGRFDFSPGDKLVFSDEHIGEYFSQLVKGSKRNVKWAFTDIETYT